MRTHLIAGLAWASLGAHSRAGRWLGGVRARGQADGGEHVPDDLGVLLEAVLGCQAVLMAGAGPAALPDRHVLSGCHADGHVRQPSAKSAICADLDIFCGSTVTLGHLDTDRL